MTQIDFAFSAPDRLRTACQVAIRRHQAGDRLVVFCRDAGRLNMFDQMLWALNDISFVPHVRVNDPLAADTPIVLTASEAATPHHDWLLNLDDEWPPIYARFQRVIEVVSNEPSDREAARARWRFYQECGHDIVRYDVSQRQLP